MNYLAHFYLAGDEDGLVAGALAGEFIKGPLVGALPPGLEAGVRLHRRIDALSDTHPAAREAILSFPPEFRRYGGILLDVYFDHCLTRQWSRWHDDPLPRFAARTYATLRQWRDTLPPAARHMADRLEEWDLLSAYGRWESVPGTLARIGQRLRRENPLALAGPVLQQREMALERVFEQVLQDVQRAVR